MSGSPGSTGEEQEGQGEGQGEGRREGKRGGTGGLCKTGRRDKGRAGQRGHGMTFAFFVVVITFSIKLPCQHWKLGNHEKVSSMIFKALASRADAFYKLKCLSVCLSVCSLFEV